ncbi:glycoside hydrolase family 97 N-terminal domain-containing protein [Paraflavitalea speifideaquila]|uniref:glycoside hydrolase family 97 N-terminal domain-containing protein n=1 Tax=Paraflavitalea speifideaquila TaxID=3076558 RepID=UPI0028E89CBA|nr:glycoside hydrolase family 97 N-terminal domain-containing protein [Paraflavitalea speifideiaquila]
MKTTFLWLASIISSLWATAQSEMAIPSPDKKLVVTAGVTMGRAWYRVQYNGEEVLQRSKLGISRQDEQFAEGLLLKSKSAVEKVIDNYNILNAKKSAITYKANKGYCICKMRLAKDWTLYSRCRMTE